MWLEGAMKELSWRQEVFPRSNLGKLYPLKIYNEAKVFSRDWSLDVTPNPA
jgi:hypothetical protein